MTSSFPASRGTINFVRNGRFSSTEGATNVWNVVPLTSAGGVLANVSYSGDLRRVDVCLRSARVPTGWIPEQVCVTSDNFDMANALNCNPGAPCFAYWGFGAYSGLRTKVLINSAVVLQGDTSPTPVMIWDTAGSASVATALTRYFPIILTPPSFYQAGILRARQLLRVDTNFTLSFTFKMSNSSSNGMCPVLVTGVTLHIVVKLA